MSIAFVAGHIGTGMPGEAQKVIDYYEKQGKSVAKIVGTFIEDTPSYDIVTNGSMSSDEYINLIKDFINDNPADIHVIATALLSYFINDIKAEWPDAEYIVLANSKRNHRGVRDLPEADKEIDWSIKNTLDDFVLAYNISARRFTNTQAKMYSTIDYD
jgi:hypothetical protein